MGRRPKYDINMDGSIGEAFTSLETNFIKENGFHVFMIWIYGYVHYLSNTYNETEMEEEERGWKELGHISQRSKVHHSVEAMLHINTNKTSTKLSKGARFSFK